MNPVQALKWTMTLLIPCGVYFLSPQDVSPHFPLYMGLTSAAIIAWALNVFPAIGVAAMLTFAYILCGVADAEVVFGPWATVLPWLSFAAVIIGEGMEKTGLAKRLALRCLKLTGGSFNGLVAGFFLAGLVLVVILPSILARVVIFCAIAVGIIQALQLDAKSRMSSTIVMMAFFAAAAPQFMFLHSSESFIWAFGMMLKGTDKTVNFWDYAYQATFINLIYYALSMATVYIVKGRETLVSGAHFSTFIEQSCREMGPIQPREIKLLVLVFGIILGFIWQFIFNRVMVPVGETLGLGIFSTSWLNDPTKAFWAMVIVTVWQYSGYMMIIYVAGFTGVPRDLIEAAGIDGCTSVQTTRYVVLPLMVPSFVICLFLSIQRCFMVYDLNLSLTNGGPYNSTKLAAMHVYQKTFVSKEYGVGQAEALILFAVVAIITVTQVWLGKRKEVDA